MKLKRILPFALCSCAVFSFVSCGDDDGDDDKQDDVDLPGVEIDGPSMEVLSSEESKEFLGNTAMSVMNKFNPKDQEEIINLTEYFAEEYGDLDFPNIKWVTESKKPANRKGNLKKNKYNPAPFMRALNRGAKGNVNEITRATYYYTYDINFDKIKGIYEPGIDEWAKVGDSKDLVINFKGPKGEKCQIVVTASADSSNYDIEDYDSWGDDYKEYYKYNISVPHVMTASLTQNGKELVMTKVNSKIDIKGHTVNAEATGKIANIDVNGVINGNDNLVNGNAKIIVSGETIVTAAAQLTGKNLCNVEMFLQDDDDYYYDDYYDDDDDYNEPMISDNIKSVAVSSDIMGKIQLVGNYNINKNVLSVFDSEFSSYDYDTEQEALKDCNRAIDILRNNGKIDIHYNGSKTVQASLDYIANSEKYNGYGYSYFEYWIVPVIKFGDNSTMTFDKYFENDRDFSNVLNTWSSLCESYARLIY